MKAKPLVVLLLILLCGCTQRATNLSSSFKEAMFGFTDIDKTEQEIVDLPYACMYARVNNGQRIFLVLAFVDINPITGNKQLKWLSADRAMIATELGRIVKTQSLPHSNLQNIRYSEPQNNHLNNPLEKATATYDWQPDYQYGHVGSIERRTIKQEQVNSVIWAKQATLVEEKIHFMDLSKSMSNLFWIDDHGHVVKSKQWLVPKQLYIELEVLKPYSSGS
ncbi:YjbF family lipoprotein [Vibrio europaeus]|uniref:YjbF family lipoprotein n=1 Tax=Vibrio europaeus TaxID=300876 RepID=A0AAE7DYS0_9VIBR|nr:YjbF family lipoprotein [Vibrio europaeus]QJY38874.1 YjbF family lipoprotein [Vibrio europaeus]